MSATTIALGAIAALLLMPHAAFADEAANGGRADGGVAVDARPLDAAAPANKVGPPAASASPPALDAPPSASPPALDAPPSVPPPALSAPPVSSLPPEPRVASPPHTWTPVVVDPQAEAVDRGLRNEADWPLAYVDRPQTLYEGMESVAVTGSELFAGPSGYERSIVGVSYARGLTNDLELGLAVARLYCSGSGWGACDSSLAPTLSLRYAALDAQEHQLAFGASVNDFVHDVRAWARLKLVVPARFSFEIQPLISWGVETVRAPAWWNPAVTQDGNQSRVSVVFDANVQLGERVVAWLDGIPYVPTARLDDPSTTALQVGGGVAVAVTKGLEISASCWQLDVFAARRWEYVPDVRECVLTLVARRFGPSPDDKVAAPPPAPY